jgi:hypothetical protein
MIDPKSCVHESLRLAVDWLDNFIGSGGLLLEVSHPFAVPVLVLWVGMEKIND